MGKDEPGEAGQQPSGGRRRKKAEGEGQSSAASRASTGGSRGSSTDPLAIEAGSFRPPEEPPPPRTAADLDAEHEYEPPPPELIEWTPDRAAAVVRGLGFGMHMLDPVGHLDGGEQLWRWTKDDALEAGEPLARIFNRYSPMRRLAGLADEAELAFIMGGYVRQNLAARGRVIAVHREAAEQQEPPLWARAPGPPPPEEYVPPPEGFAPWAGAEPPEGG